MGTFSDEVKSNPAMRTVHRLKSFEKVGHSFAWMHTADEYDGRAIETLRLPVSCLATSRTDRSIEDYA